MYGLSPKNTHPTKGFRARSEERAKSCLCILLYAVYAPFKALLKVKKDEEARNCDLLSRYCLAHYLPIVYSSTSLIIYVRSIPYKHAP